MDVSQIPSAICSLISDVGVTLNSDNHVERWADQSGSGNDAIKPNQLGPDYAPDLLNGKKVLRLGSPLSVPLTSSPEYSFFALINPSLKNEGNIFFGSDGAPGTARWAFGVGSASDYGAGWGGNGSNANLGSSDHIIINQWQLLSYIRKASGWDLYRNSQFIRTVSDGSYMTYQGSHEWCIGRESKGTDTYQFSGQIAQLLILEEAVKNGQRKKIERSIMNYWGL